MLVWLLAVILAVIGVVELCRARSSWPSCCSSPHASSAPGGYSIFRGDRRGV